MSPRKRTGSVCRSILVSDDDQPGRCSSAKTNASSESASGTARVRMRAANERHSRRADSDPHYCCRVPKARTITARAAAVVLLALPPVIAFSAGGFFEGARLRAGILVWVAVALVALTAPDAFVLPRRSWLALGCLAGLALWMTLSILWSPLRDGALGDAERLWLYAGYALLAAALLRGTLSAWVEPALGGGATLVAAYALATRLVPGIVPSERTASAGARLDQPLTYWNSFGLLMAI